MGTPLETGPNAAGDWSIVVVSDEVGWPPTSGYRRRTAELVQVAASLGRVRWIAAPRGPHEPDTGFAASIGVDVTTVAVPTRTPWSTAWRWARTSLPWALAAADWSDADQAIRGAAGSVDLLIAMGIDAYVAARRGGIHARVELIDTDLESEKLRSRVEGATDLGRIRRLVARRDVVRWRALETQVDRTADAISLPSQDETTALGNGWFVPNGYAAPPTAGEPSTRERTRVLFVGSLSYGPNHEGLAWLLDAVWPDVRSRHPEAVLRVVGGGLDDAHPAHDTEGVEVLGRIDDLTLELQRASVAVVPIHWGGGTRIKILEAFAYGVATVSTTLGAAGLDAEHGRELLLADEPRQFADAIDQLFADDELRSRLVTHGRRLLEDRFDAATIRADLRRRLDAALREGR